MFSEEGAEKVEDTVKEMFYDVIFPTMSQFEKGSEWSLAHPTDEEKTETTTDTSQREKTTQKILTEKVQTKKPPKEEVVTESIVTQVQQGLLDMPEDDDFFYACAKYLGFLALSSLFITKFICTKNSTLRRVRLL